MKGETQRKERGMKVYIVTDGEYSDYHIEAVFTDKKQAELYSVFHNGDVEEWETDKSYFDEGTKLFVVHKIRIIRRTDIVFEVEKLFGSLRPFTRLDDDPFHGITIYVSLEERDDKKALKIAQDMYAKHKYERSENGK